MQTAILIPGTCDKEEYYSTDYPSASNFHWFPWLTKELIVRDIHTVTLEMPHSYMPNYDIWKRELERFDIGHETILVGHSCGGGFLLRYLSENPNVKVKKVVLVAPWLDPDNRKENNFFDFTYQSDIYAQVEKGISLFVSTDDADDILKSVEIIEKEFSNILITQFQKKGHFCLGDLGTQAFPELLEKIIK